MLYWAEAQSSQACSCTRAWGSPHTLHHIIQCILSPIPPHHVFPALIRPRLPSGEEYYFLSCAWAGSTDCYEYEESVLLS